MTDRRDNTPGLHPDWAVMRHKCPFCGILTCGCPAEPEPILIPPKIHLGQE